MAYKRKAATPHGKTIAEWVSILSSRGDRITPNGMRGRIKRHPSWDPRTPWEDHRDESNKGLSRLRELEKMAISGLIKSALASRYPVTSIACLASMDRNDAKELLEMSSRKAAKKSA